MAFCSTIHLIALGTILDQALVTLDEECRWHNLQKFIRLKYKLYLIEILTNVQEFVAYLDLPYVVIDSWSSIATK